MFSILTPLLHIENEVAQVSIGVHNEYFLHHRRSGRRAFHRRLSGSALIWRFFDLDQRELLPSGPSCKTLGARQTEGAFMIRSFTVVALMFMTSGETATAFDLKRTLKDLMPCKYAAIRLCERPQQVSAAALWKCGATLAAAPQEEIGKRCVAVLKRYGAALN